MYRNPEVLQKSLDLLQKDFGYIRSSCPEYDFTFTDYYKKEFGESLKKRIFIFNRTIEKQDLIEIRAKTGQIEKKLSIDGKRTVNIDPGYISGTELILATRKFRSFKEELGSGVFAHKVIELSKGEIITFRHTFADYRMKSNLEFFRRFLNT